MSLLNFFNCVLNNDIDAVKSYLEYGGRKRVKNLAIIYAAAFGNAEMVAVLLQAGVPVNTFDVLTIFQRKWESSKLKKLQASMESDMKEYTRGWAPILTAACVAAFYGHENVLDVISAHDISAISFNPYLQPTTLFLGDSEPPSWNAVTCALMGNQWSIASKFVDMGFVTTDMEEQYPLFLEFRTKVKIPTDVINVVFSYL